MTTLTVAAIQVAYGDGEPVADRVARVAQLVRDQRGVDVVVLPELWAPGGFAYQQWEDNAEPLDGPTAQAMASAARDCEAVLHAGSIVERLPQPGPEGRTLANTSLVFDPEGELIATYQKIHRFGFGQGEPVLMEAGQELAFVDFDSEADDGHLDARLALSTCYDLRFPELYRSQVNSDANVFLVPAAWPKARVAHWELLGRARAVENQAYVVAVNTGGTHAGVPMGGRSQIVDPRGEVLAIAGEGEEVITATLDLDAITEYRTVFPVLADQR